MEKECIIARLAFFCRLKKIKKKKTAVLLRSSCPSDDIQFPYARNRYSSTVHANNSQRFSIRYWMNGATRITSAKPVITGRVLLPPRALYVYSYQFTAKLYRKTLPRANYVPKSQIGRFSPTSVITSIAVHRYFSGFFSPFSDHNLPIQVEEASSINHG